MGMYDIGGLFYVTGRISLLLFWREPPPFIIVHDAVHLRAEPAQFQRVSDRTEVGKGGKRNRAPTRRDGVDAAARHDERLSVVEKVRDHGICRNRRNARPVK